MSNGRYRSFCKTCMNELGKKYKQKNKIKISEYNRKYNKDNRRAIQTHQNITRSNRMINDFGFFIAVDLRLRLHKYIKSNFKLERELMEKIIGCSSEILMIWIVYLFTDKMLFLNYGEYWTIDHVDPVSNYDLTNSENISLCFHWMNLRPSVKPDNQEKSNQINEDEQNNHLELIKKFQKNILPKFNLLTN